MKFPFWHFFPLLLQKPAKAKSKHKTYCIPVGSCFAARRRLTLVTGDNKMYRNFVASSELNSFWRDHSDFKMYRNYVDSSALNSFWRDHSRDDEMIESLVDSLRTREINCLSLNDPPVDEEFGRRVAQALTSNADIKKISFVPSLRSRGVTLRAVLQWLTVSTSTAGEMPEATLAHSLSLNKVVVEGPDYGVEDWNLTFRLLLTSTSLQELELFTRSNWHGDRVMMSALSQYLGAATRVSLRTLELYTDGLSETAFASLRDGVAGSELRRFDWYDHNEEFLETDIESLARMIAESSLEEVAMPRFLCHAAFLHTLPVQNLDISFSNIKMDGWCPGMKVNRKWKPLLTANIPLGLWPKILEKAHASPETSHGPAGILFHILRAKPDLVR
jgi:hypothetical protein